MIKGRIIKGIGGIYTVDANDVLYECSIRGIFRKNKIVPTVGDYVDVEILDDLKFKGSIEKIYDRKNIMIRPRISNIDCAVITFAAKSPDINFDLLDRFLILAEKQNIKKTVICINKADLADNDTINYIKDIYSPVYDVIFTSTVNNTGIENLKSILQESESFFAGPSGVGKSSIINCILPFEKLKTGTISTKIKRGKHTTRQVELIKICRDTYIADTPGFTSLNLEIEPDKLQFYFKEFKPFIDSCRFNDCLHQHEPDCAVKNNVGISISNERYERYSLLLEELKQRR